LGCAANPAAGVELQSKRGPGEANAIRLVWAVLATGGRPPERRAVPPSSFKRAVVTRPGWRLLTAACNIGNDVAVMFLGVV